MFLCNKLFVLISTLDFLYLIWKALEAKNCQNSPVETILISILSFTGNDMYDCYKLCFNIVSLKYPSLVPYCNEKRQEILYSKMVHLRKILLTESRGSSRFYISGVRFWIQALIEKENIKCCHLWIPKWGSLRFGWNLFPLNFLP